MDARAARLGTGSFRNLTPGALRRAGEPRAPHAGIFAGRGAGDGLNGRSIAVAVYRDGAPRLTRIFLDGTAPVPLVAEYSIDPAWSPDGRFLIYSGAGVGTTFPLRAVANDGPPYQIPPLMLTRGARHVVFRADSAAIVTLRGDIGHKSLWLVDLRTGTQQQLTDFAGIPDIRDFDLAGAAVVFDRTQESSHIGLIERGG